MSFRYIALTATCCALAAVLGCKSAPNGGPSTGAAKTCSGQCKGAPKTDAEAPMPGRVECPTKKGKICDGSEACLKRGKECPKANYPGTIARHKMMALMEATQSNSLHEIRAAAKTLADAMAKHKPANEKLAKQSDYVERENAAIAAIHKVIVQRSTMDATRAAKAIAATCADCHEAQK